MKVSVAIAAYNASTTIRATLDSVLAQTIPPDEIIVVNDGSTDSTASILKSYSPQVIVIEQENGGLSSARNVLCRQAQGDLIAFLDADDVWHPRYIEVQRRLYQDYPNAAAFFTGHVNFSGQETYPWHCDDPRIGSGGELIDPLSFLRRYCKATAPFASPSYCCVPRWILDEIGREPFDASVRVCDDAYLFYSIALLGPIAYDPARVVAYRITEGSLSSDALQNHRWGVYVFALLEDRYRRCAHTRLLRAFRLAFASKRRQYAKVLMGAGEVDEARHELWQSLTNTGDPRSLAKSLALLGCTYMPRQLQPKWPARYRSQQAHMPAVRP